MQFKVFFFGSWPIRFDKSWFDIMKNNFRYEMGQKFEVRNIIANRITKGIVTIRNNR